MFNTRHRLNNAALGTCDHQLYRSNQLDVVCTCTLTTSIVQIFEVLPDRVANPLPGLRSQSILDIQRNMIYSRCNCIARSRVGVGMGRTTRKLIDCYCMVAALINPPWLSEQGSSLVIPPTNWMQTPYTYVYRNLLPWSRILTDSKTLTTLSY